MGNGGMENRGSKQETKYKMVDINPHISIITINVNVIIDTHIHLQFPGAIYSWSSISTGSACVDSTNHPSKIFQEISRKFQKAKLEFALHWKSLT